MLPFDHYTAAESLSFSVSFASAASFPVFFLLLEEIHLQQAMRKKDMTGEAAGIYFGYISLISGFRGRWTDSQRPV